MIENPKPTVENLESNRVRLENEYQNATDLFDLYGHLQNANTLQLKIDLPKKDIRDIFLPLVAAPTLQFHPPGEVIHAILLLSKVTNLSLKDIYNHLLIQEKSEYHLKLAESLDNGLNITLKSKFKNLFSKEKSGENGIGLAIDSFSRYVYFDREFGNSEHVIRNQEGKIKQVLLDGMRITYDEEMSSYVFDFIPFGYSSIRDLVKALKRVETDSSKSGLMRERLNERILDMFKTDFEKALKVMKSNSAELMSEHLYGETNPFFESFITKIFPDVQFTKNQGYSIAQIKLTNIPENFA